MGGCTSSKTAKDDDDSPYAPTKKPPLDPKQDPRNVQASSAANVDNNVNEWSEQLTGLGPGYPPRNLHSQDNQQELKAANEETRPKVYETTNPAYLSIENQYENSQPLQQSRPPVPHLHRGYKMPEQYLTVYDNRRNEWPYRNSQETIRHSQEVNGNLQGSQNQFHISQDRNQNFDDRSPGQNQTIQNLDNANRSPGYQQRDQNEGNRSPQYDQNIDNWSPGYQQREQNMDNRSPGYGQMNQNVDNTSPGYHSKRSSGYDQRNQSLDYRSSGHNLQHTNQLEDSGYNGNTPHGSDGRNPYEQDRSYVTLQSANRNMTGTIQNETQQGVYKTFMNAQKRRPKKSRAHTEPPLISDGKRYTLVGYDHNETKYYTITDLDYPQYSEVYTDAGKQQRRESNNLNSPNRESDANARSVNSQGRVVTTTVTNQYNNDDTYMNLPPNLPPKTYKEETQNLSPLSNRTQGIGTDYKSQTVTTTYVTMNSNAEKKLNLNRKSVPSSRKRLTEIPGKEFTMRKSNPPLPVVVEHKVFGTNTTYVEQKSIEEQNNQCNNSLPFKAYKENDTLTNTNRNYTSGNDNQDMHFEENTTDSDKITQIVQHRNVAGYQEQFSPNDNRGHSLNSTVKKDHTNVNLVQKQVIYQEDYNRHPQPIWNTHVSNNQIVNTVTISSSTTSNDAHFQMNQSEETLQKNGEPRSITVVRRGADGYNHQDDFLTSQNGYYSYNAIPNEHDERYNRTNIEHSHHNEMNQPHEISHYRDNQFPKTLQRKTYHQKEVVYAKVNKQQPTKNNHISLLQIQPTNFTEEEHHTFQYVAALDLGYSYSGYAYAASNNPSQMFLNKNWAASMGYTSFKTPSAFLVDAQRRFLSYGYEAHSQLSALLDENESNLYQFKLYSQFREKPKSKDVQWKWKTALWFLRRDCAEAIENTFDIRNNNRVKIKWILPLPKEYMNDQDLHSIQTCLSQIGVDEQSVGMYSDADCALQYCLSQGRHVEASEGNQCVLLSAGDSAVTCTLFCYSQRTGWISGYNNSARAGCDITAKFINFLKARLDEEFITKIQKEMPTVWNNFMGTFDNAKRSISLHNKKSGGVKIPLENIFAEYFNDCTGKSLKNVLSSDPFISLSTREGALYIPYSTFPFIFNEILDDIEKKLRAVINKGQYVSTVFLVGGFGNCLWVKERVSSVVGALGKNLIIPEEPEVCAVKGAVLKGMSESSV